MPPPSLARNFFEQVRSAPDPVAFIQALTASSPPTYEKDWLDFKLPPSPKLSDGKWLEIWSKALAGFANNQGGVIIWGIDARKDPDTQIDAASGMQPVVNPEAVKSRLIELQRQATDPPLANVEIEAYEIPATGTGFILCFIPEGPYKPYRTDDGRKQFYVRSGDNFSVLSRSMLQAMFFPKVRAVFGVKAELSLGKVERPGEFGVHLAPLSCSVHLTNRGTGTAKQTWVQVSHNFAKDLQPLHFSCPSMWAQLRTGTGQEFETGNPIHPGRAVQLFYVEWKVTAESPPGAKVYDPVPDCPAPSFELGVFCENQERQVIRIEFDMGEVIATGKCVREACPTE